MSLYKQFGTNKQAEAEGVAIEYGVNEDGSKIEFVVSRMSKSNTRYQKAMERAMRPHRRALELETLDNKVAEALMLEVFCESILIGWNGVQGRDGKAIAHSKDAAIRLLSDLPDLYEDLQNKARGASLFREEELEADAKN